MSSQGRAAAAPSASSIISPAVDFLLVGGLSLIVFVPLLLSGRTDLVWIGAGAQAWIATLINMPHFMASYRVVYRDRAMIMKHKWATIYIPAILPRARHQGRQDGAVSDRSRRPDLPRSRRPAASDGDP